jgi:predicted Zn finger-like uncharacterized protein
MSIVLSCPSCSTRYRADPQAIGATGRRVRCASCGHTWNAEVEDPSGLPALEDLPGTGEDEIAEPKKPHEAFRERQAAKRRTMSAAAAGGAWGGLLAAWALFAVAAWHWRVDVVTIWPRAASAYAAVGMDVNPYGFEVGELTITRESEHGVPLLIIEGSVRNFDRRTRAVPVLRARLKDNHAASLLEWNIPVSGGAVRSGETRQFRTVVSDPDPATIEAEVVLVSADSGHAETPEDHGTDHDTTESADAEHAPEPASEQESEPESGQDSGHGDEDDAGTTHAEPAHPEPAAAADEHH